MPFSRRCILLQPQPDLPVLACSVAQCLLCCPLPAAEQYTEPLEVEDLEAKGWKKFDGTRQYARDKRRQVRLQARCSGQRQACRFVARAGPQGTCLGARLGVVHGSMCRLCAHVTLCIVLSGSLPYCRLLILLPWSLHKCCISWATKCLQLVRFAHTIHTPAALLVPCRSQLLSGSTSGGRRRASAHEHTPCTPAGRRQMA